MPRIESHPFQQRTGLAPLFGCEPSEQCAAGGHHRQQTGQHVACHAHAQRQVEMLMDHRHALAQGALGVTRPARHHPQAEQRLEQTPRVVHRAARLARSLLPPPDRARAHTHAH
jgi:hypothetical protein